MQTPLLELEGTVEEIQERLAEFAGRRLRLTVLSAEASPSDTSVTTPRKLTIEEKILARFNQIPPEERAKIPPDLSDNLRY